LRRAESFGRTRRPGTRVREVPQNGESMILPVVVVLKDIYEKGRDYLWPRPEVCPRCKAGRPWGHGFVLAYFDGLTAGVLLRRYRCPHCCCVIRLKPEGYFDRFQSSIATIRAVMRELVAKKLSPSGVPRTRRDHWLKALKRKARACFGDPFKHDLLAAFDQLMGMGIIPVSRSI